MRFRTYGPKDDPAPDDGDAVFLRFATRGDGVDLPPGVLRDSQNLRLGEKRIKPRKGSKALATDLELSNPPLVLDVALAEDLAVASITRSGTTATATTTLDHGYTTGDIVAIEGADQADYNIDATITVTGLKTFTYTVANSPTTPATGTITCNKGPALFGTYEDIVRGSCVYTSDTNVDGFILALSDRAFVARAGEASVEIAYPGGETCDAPVYLTQFEGLVYLHRDGDVSMSWDRNTANDFVLVSQSAISGTLVPMPTTGWSAPFNRRLWMPYARDQLIGSDYSDAGTFDTQYAQLRIRPGGPDWLIGAIGYQDVRVFVAYRKSMHLVSLNVADLTISGVDEVEGEFGCVARETIRKCGGHIFFLTDGGVARLRITNELNLVADPLPISEDIQDQFERVNWAVADKAVAAYHGNRYYLALPVDGSETNNAIFIYSFLNGGGWETVDTYPGDFDVQALHLANYAGQQRLHAVTTYGSLYLLEEGEVDEFGAGDAITEHVIPGTAKTRYLRHGNSDVKRWLRSVIELDLAAGDGLDIAVALRNPDQSAALLTIAASAADDVTRRPRIGRRGVACSLEITTTAGRPELKSYTLEASMSDRSNKDL